MSNSRPWSGQPNSHGVRARWAELEMGRNSVIPWRMARTRTWTNGMMGERSIQISVRTTKIVATLGPASNSRDVIAKLLAAGVNVFRMNMSHGTQEDHSARIRLVREVCQEAGSLAGLLLDLQGPKIRLGLFDGGKAELRAGNPFEISTV